jgi:hypothetical protein
MPKLLDGGLLRAKVMDGAACYAPSATGMDARFRSGPPPKTRKITPEVFGET